MLTFIKIPALQNQALGKAKLLSYYMSSTKEVTGNYYCVLILINKELISSN